MVILVVVVEEVVVVILTMTQFLTHDSVTSQVILDILDIQRIGALLDLMQNQVGETRVTLMAMTKLMRVIQVMAHQVLTHKR